MPWQRGTREKGCQVEGDQGRGAMVEGRHDRGAPWRRGAMTEAPQDIVRLWGWTSRARRAEPAMGRQQASNRLALRCGPEGRKPRVSLYLEMELGLEPDVEGTEDAGSTNPQPPDSLPVRSAGVTTQGLPTLDPPP